MIPAASAHAVAGVDPLVLLVTAFGGAIVAVVGGLIGAWLQGRREHRKWIRERRLVRYDAVLDAAAEAHFAKSINDEPGFVQGLTATSAAVASILLVGPDEVHDLADNVRGALITFEPDGKHSLDYYTTRGLFVLAARDALAIEHTPEGKKRRALEKKSPTPPRGSGAFLEPLRKIGEERGREARERSGLS
jgi:hypothetical protein